MFCKLNDANPQTIHVISRLWGNKTRKMPWVNTFARHCMNAFFVLLSSYCTEQNVTQFCLQLQISIILNALSANLVFSSIISLIHLSVYKILIIYPSNLSVCVLFKGETFFLIWEVPIRHAPPARAFCHVPERFAATAIRSSPSNNASKRHWAGLRKSGKSGCLPERKTTTWLK